MSSVATPELLVQLSEAGNTAALNPLATEAFMEATPDFHNIPTHDFQGVPEDTSLVPVSELLARVFVTDTDRAIAAGAVAVARGAVEVAKATGRRTAALGGLAVAMAKRALTASAAAWNTAKEAVQPAFYRPQHSPRAFGTLAVRSLVRPRPVRAVAPVPAVLHQETVALPFLPGLQPSRA